MSNKRGNKKFEIEKKALTNFNCTRSKSFGNRIYSKMRNKIDNEKLEIKKILLINFNFI